MTDFPDPLVSHAVIQARWATVKLEISRVQRMALRDCEAARRYAECSFGNAEVLMQRAMVEFRFLDDAVKKVDEELTKLADKDVVLALLEKRDNWARLTVEFDQIHEGVGRMRMDNWFGAAKDQYQRLIPTQLRALAEMSGLCTSQSVACNNLALVNAQMFSAILAGVNRVSNCAHAYSAASTLDEGAKTIDGQRWTDFDYLYRSETVRNTLDAFREWLTQQSDPARADWARAAQEMNDALADLTSGTTNLQAHGVWPGVGVVVGDEASNAGGATQVEVRVADPFVFRRGGAHR